MDRLDAMAAFVAVAELRSFTGAARRLRVSPPVVTRLIAGLEERLGVRLLQRTTRSVRLTDGGARYIERARRILADVAEAEGAAQSEDSEPMGRFALTASNLFGRLHVTPVLSRFLDRHPKVVAELILSDRNLSLVDEGIDLAVRIGSLEDSTLVTRRVGGTRRVVVAAPAYLAGRRRLRTPADIAAHQVVQFTGITPRPEWRFFGSASDTPVPFTPAFVTNSIDAAIHETERGRGLSMLLAYQVAPAVRRGRLRVVLAKFEPPPLPIHLAYPSKQLLSAKVRAFVDLVATTCDWQFVTP
ncbi:MAG: LysR family transcriptional regulator [Deltaproteobacteria bacterium]|nr:LysR family transcriptional regulator [Deltaproteobacteria bacterium]